MFRLIIYTIRLTKYLIIDISVHINMCIIQHIYDNKLMRSIKSGYKCILRYKTHEYF